MPTAEEAAVAAENQRKVEYLVVAVAGAALGAGVLKWGLDLAESLKRSRRGPAGPWDGSGDG